MIPPPVGFPGLQVNPGFTFSTGVSVPSFLQPGVHTQAGTQGGKPSHIPYSQQRPSGPGPGQGPGSSGPGPMNQGPSQGQQPQTPSQQALQQSVQLQVQAMSQQQQQSPTKPVQQVGMGKSPPHHPGMQQVSVCRSSSLAATSTNYRGGQPALSLIG